MTGWTRGQVLLRVLIFTGPMLALYATDLVGPAPAGWLVALAVVLSVAFAAMPDAPFGALVMLLVLAWWGISLHDGLHRARSCNPIVHFGLHGFPPRNPSHSPILQALLCWKF